MIMNPKLIIDYGNDISDIINTNPIRRDAIDKIRNKLFQKFDEKLFLKV